MAKYTISLPLYNEPHYSYSVNLEQVSYTLSFTYNETMKLYTLGIKDAEGNTLISGVGLLPSYPLLQEYSVGSLTGTFLMIPIANTKTEFYKLYPKNLNTYYKLYYYYDDSTVE